MRVSSDKTSWRAGGVLRRDFRSEKGAPELPKPRKRRHGKKCKRTCFGRPGLLHEWRYEPRPYDALTSEMLPPWLRWICGRCVRCGRKAYIAWGQGVF